MSETRLTKCPETGELVEVELERTTLGLVVQGCTRFHPRNGMECSRGCVKRMDIAECSKLDNRERVVIVLANMHDDAAHIAGKLADDLAGDGLTVELANIGTCPPPPLADYDGIVVGARVRFGRHPRAIVDFVRSHREQLESMPASFYSVGGHGAYDRDGYITRLARRTGWRPITTASFGNADPIQRPAIHDFAHHVADEIPAALQPTML
jgi:menaquinone-dependent protoporphyrinogen IX oxidase